MKYGPNTRLFRGKTLFGVTVALISSQFACLAADGTDSLPGYVTIPFSIPIDAETVHLIDLNADTREDLIIEFDAELRIVHQQSHGFDWSKYQSISIPERFAMWDVSRNGLEGGKFSILVLDADSNLTIWQPSGNSYQSAVVDVPVRSIHVPEDTKRSRFCIDINGDSIDDLVLSTTHSVHIVEVGRDNEFVGTAKIAPLSTSSTSLSADELSDRVGQWYTASPAVFRDIDNDSHTDVIFQNDSVVRITLGNATETTYFSPIPDYDVTFEKDQRKIHFDSIDFSNLFTLFRFAPNRVQIKDVNQDQLVDLIILEPNRLISYIAGENGIDTSRPTQIMRFNENTLVGEILDINEDGKSDLVAVKTPRVSVRRVLLTLAVPATLRFEFLVFNHSEEMFSRRPDYRKIVNLRVPALLPMMVKSRNAMKAEEEARANAASELLGTDTKPPMPILDAQLDDVEANDVIAIQSGEVCIYFNVLTKDSMFSERSEFDDVLDLLRSSDEITIDIGTVIESSGQITTHLDLLTDIEPVVIHRLSSDAEFHDLLRVRLNDDALDDILIFEDRTEEAISGVVLLSQDR